MDLSERLKELRIEANLTQKELANKLKIGQSTIVGYEKGEREATISNLSRYADYFEVSLDFLYGREDDFGIKKANNTSPLSTYSKEEQQLIEDFRALNYSCQKLVKDTIKTLCTSTAQSEKKKNG